MLLLTTKSEVRYPHTGFCKSGLLNYYPDWSKIPEFPSIDRNSSKRPIHSTNYSFFFPWNNIVLKITGIRLNSLRSWILIEREYILMKYPISRRFRSFFNVSEQFFYPIIEPAHENNLRSGREDPLRRDQFIRVHQILCQPPQLMENLGRRESGSWKHWSSSILVKGSSVEWIFLDNPVHDIHLVKKMLRQCHRPRKSDNDVLDEEYDSENIHVFTRDTLHSHSLIPV